MQEAVPEGQGAMAAILGLEDERVVDICTQAAQGAIVDAVNFNAPGQVVIAGNADAVTRAMESAKQSGAKRVLLLPVSVPSHCSLMEPAALRLKEMLQDIEIRSPAVPVINNVDIAVNDDPEAIKDALVRQLYRPVRWVEIIRHMASNGIDTLVECGPGKVLAGLNRRIDKTMAALPVYDLVTLDAAMEKSGDG
jgi:[acyl-carrier-protein] S-malonyltransferase